MKNSCVSPKNIPHINVIVDEEADRELFLRFLNHPQYPGKKAVLLNCYPQITGLITEGFSEEAAVKEIVGSLYAEHQLKIQTIVHTVKEALNGADKLFADLARLMGNISLSQKRYTAILTVLPFSPIKESTLYVSIYQEIHNHVNKIMGSAHFLHITLHEISHFVFFEQLEKWEKLREKKLAHAAAHYFKEALTAAIFNQPPLCRLFVKQKTVKRTSYRGNAELHDVFVRYQDVDKNIVDFFQAEMFDNKSSYRKNLFNLLDLFAAHEDDFAEKWKIWNKQQLGDRNGAIRQEYAAPIVLNGSDAS